DLDGRRYLDFVGSWGPLILGHGHPRVVAAVAEALRQGASFGAPTERESELAELIVAAVPSIELVRMVSSGTEATMSAIRLARGFTGRDLIVKFAGCYHGHVDSLLVQAGSGALTHGVPSSPGVPRGCTADTLVLHYNNAEELAEAFRAQGDRIAGGRADVMKQVSPAGQVYQAGTLSGNPLAMAAGIATLRELRDHPPYERLERMGAALAEGLRSAATAAEVPHRLNRAGSMWTLF